jgi:hypothetical protein
MRHGLRRGCPHPPCASVPRGSALPSGDRALPDARSLLVSLTPLATLAAVLQAFGIQMVGLGCVSFYVARALLSCGARTAEARKEAATEAANRVEGERLDSSRVNSPYTRRSESSNTVIGCRDSKDALEDTGGLRPTSPGSSLRPLDGIVTMLRQGHRTPTKAGSPLLPRARPAASPHAARSPAAAAIEGREEALEDGRLQGLKRDAMNLASQGATSHTGKPTELV